MDVVFRQGARAGKWPLTRLACALALAAALLAAQAPRAGADTITHIAGTTPAPGGFFPSALPPNPALPANPVTGANLPSFATGVLASESNFPQNISLPQFNPAMGTLTGVHLDFLTFEMANMTITNLEPTATETASGNLNMTLTLGNPAGGNLSSVPHSLGVAATIAAGQTVNIDGQGFYDLGVADPAVAALWQGLGNVLFPVSFATQNAVNVSGGDNSQAARFRGFAEVQVTYTFTPNQPPEPPPTPGIPEPSTLLLMGLAFGGVGAYRRFARRKAA